jgi:hypothetical protein
MLPITIDAARVRIVLIGNGQAARRRLALLDDAGATRVEVYAEAPLAVLAAAAGGRLRRRLPTAEEIARANSCSLPALASRPRRSCGISRTMPACCSTSRTTLPAATSIRQRWYGGAT